ncbi:MAG: hypothetical protein CVU89_06975 [Firmicutes bacterium HGW-Firmicutes-14]|nr:MAG: hypothetical protein CVU89_06975 [Firmicutes bacterium HGW-Firmicutes-14]
MVFSVRGTVEKKQKEVNVQEAYNIWDLLNSKYFAVEQIQISENFAHDPDLLLFVKDYKKDLMGQIDNIEKKMQEHSIKGVDRPRKGVNTSANTEIFTDQLISESLFLMLQEDVEMYLRAIRTSVTNDSIRKLFTDQAVKGVKNLDRLVKYLKVKGWLNQAPMYPNIPIGTPERIDCGEAFHLWDHLTFRYDNIEQTQIYYEIAHDGDFKTLLKHGLEEVLQEQAGMLEKELLYFGLPMPKRPPKKSVGNSSPECLEDDHMFRMILAGMQGAAILHANALKQCITNDRIRKIFRRCCWRKYVSATT